MDEVKKLEQHEVRAAAFKNYKGKLEKIYSNDRTISAIMGGRPSYSDLKRLRNRDQMLVDMDAALLDQNKASAMSESLAASNSVYQEIISYYKSMPLYRYTVVPDRVKRKDEKIDKKEYAEKYEEMISVVEGISIEISFPKILEKGLIEGTVFIYTDKNKNSETIETLLLPRKYCKRGFTTNFGTDTVIFDFTYIDEMKRQFMSGMGPKDFLEADFLAMFPDGLIAQYNSYKSDTKLRWQQLDPSFAASISFSSSGLPPKLSANYGIIDYTTTKENEVRRSSNELEKILVHTIPHNADGDLMFEVDEALELHDYMSKTLSSVKGLKLLTTFGATELIELQAERTKENKTVLTAYDGVYYATGMNPAIFRGDSAESLKISIAKDSAYVFEKLDLIVNFYNLAINNLYNFGPYQAKISLLPITVYNEQDKMTLYRENAMAGIGKLETVVASGIRQKDISNINTLETFLKLDTILVPLQSAHTQTAAAKTEPKTPEETAIPAVKTPKTVTKTPLDKSKSILEEGQEVDTNDET